VKYWEARVEVFKVELYEAIYCLDWGQFGVLKGTVMALAGFPEIL